MTTQGEQPDIIIEATTTEIVPVAASGDDEYQAAIDGLSAMVGNYMRENERLRAFLQGLVQRGDNIGKAAKLILDNADMTVEALTKRGLL